ncbi:hypothetical protein [Pseudokordiimonas caeni]|uniref:hypothetical protein n=1 Tax=Pseudokordiimonas caeni TaxID=2997908 RepID=UPI00281211F3|nr:hypothetical protein [Pseudokordiimonas caeni]
MHNIMRNIAVSITALFLSAASETYGTGTDEASKATKPVISYRHWVEVGRPANFYMLERLGSPTSARVCDAILEALNKEHSAAGYSGLVYKRFGRPSFDAASWWVYSDIAMASRLTLEWSVVDKDQVLRMPEMTSADLDGDGEEEKVFREMVGPSGIHRHNLYRVPAALAQKAWSTGSSMRYLRQLASQSSIYTEGNSPLLTVNLPDSEGYVDPLDGYKNIVNVSGEYFLMVMRSRSKEYSENNVFLRILKVLDNSHQTLECVIRSTYTIKYI